MHYEMPQIGNAIKASRESKNMTQVTLAEKANVALRTVIAIENNQRYPTYEVFYKLIRVLDISTDQIFWSEKSELTVEQEQVIREFLACSEREQAIIMKTMRTLVRSLREENTI